MQKDARSDAPSSIRKIITNQCCSKQPIMVDSFDYMTESLSFTELLQEDDINLSFMNPNHGHVHNYEGTQPSQNFRPFNLPNYCPSPTSHNPFVSSTSVQSFPVLPSHNASPFYVPAVPLPALSNGQNEPNPFYPSSLSVNAAPPVVISANSNNYHPLINNLNTQVPAMMIQTTGRMYEIIEQQFEPSPPTTVSVDNRNIYLRWCVSPPDRVHATSPSRLVTHPRPGAPFDFSVQLVAHSSTIDKYVPYVAEKDITLSACIYGKRKPKTGAGKLTFNTRNDFVKLLTNPAGNPLLLCGESSTVEVFIKKGESVGIFRDLSLTCGSNAARSRKALPAARCWDWDYHLLVQANCGDVLVHSLMSRHLTTDSNRSQTREKRKLEEETTGDTSFPLAKRRKLSDASSCSDSGGSDEESLHLFHPSAIHNFASKDLHLTRTISR